MWIRKRHTQTCCENVLAVTGCVRAAGIMVQMAIEGCTEEERRGGLLLNKAIQLHLLNVSTFSTTLSCSVIHPIQSLTLMYLK